MFSNFLQQMCHMQVVTKCQKTQLTGDKATSFHPDKAYVNFSHAGHQWLRILCLPHNVTTASRSHSDYLIRLMLLFY
jgi:hypothetical protein